MSRSFLLLQRADFHMSASALDAIFDFLDVNNDGEIDLRLSFPYNCFVLLIL